MNIPDTILFKTSVLACFILGLSPVEGWTIEPSRHGKIVPAGPGKVVPAGRGKGHWRTYGVPEGLADTRVFSIFQDREGLLWFGTLGGGVSRYDGQTFTSFTTQDGLAHNSVTSVVQDREGSLWFGTDGGGVSRYDGQTFTSFTTQDGLAHNSVLSGFQDREGLLWFGTQGGGVSRYDGQTFTSFTTQDGLAHNSVWSIIQDREGFLWFGTFGGVSRYDGQTFTTFTTQDGLARNIVWSIIQDREGLIWFATFGGVSRYDGQTFTSFTTQDGLAHNRVWSVFQDREGLLWFGTGSGASRYDGGTFTSFTTQDGLARNIVWSIIQDREGLIWFGTDGGGVSRYDGQTFTSFTTQDGLAHNRVLSVFQDREGLLWFGTWNGGVSRYDGETFTTFTTQDGLAHNSVLSVFQDREGLLWFGTWNGGVSRYDGESFTTFTTQDGLAHNTVRSIVQDREGLLWFGTWNGGVSRYDGESFTTFTTQDGLAHNTVRSIVQDREGLLWFGTDGGGVSRYDGEAFTTFTTQDGLAHNRVRSIFQDREGLLWFGTLGGGVSRYDGQTFNILTVQDGLAHNSVRPIFQDREGSLWFGTDGGGVTRYRPPAPNPPPVFIDAVLADRRYEGVSDIAIPSSVALTMFEFHGISFKTRPEQMVYRYRLKGYEDWQTTHDRRVEYQDLPRGTYTFEVQAVDRDLVSSKTPATLALTVHLPYERIGLLSALGIAVVLVGWQTVRVIRRDRRLSITNNALSDANKQLFGLNRELRQERLVERIRGEVQAMEKAEDFDNLLSTLAEDLKAVGLSFTTCGIEVLNEPVDKPTMEHFETHGYHYTAYTIDPEGSVLHKSYPLSAPFPDVIEDTLHRFVAGEPWQGVSSNTAIVEIPIAQYGRLRLTASEREQFSDDEIETLQDFATAIALGYTRYLDFVNLEAANKEIQIQTDRKSEFLASMSHELRTPLTAIRGYVDNMLDGIAGELNERQARNLTRVGQNSDHLLELINNLLDITKIEAGRMDVDVASFSVETLITTCCDTIEPLIKSGVELKTEVSEGADDAFTDQSKLRYVIGNLLSNAVKFTDQGEITVRAKKIHDQLVISVSDTGVGMPKESLETIFDEFQQVDGSEQVQKGTGLGLAIAKKYAELLEGTIFVDSEVDKGTTFTVQIPVIYKET